MPKGLIFLNEICQNTSLPVYGIGGIKLHQQQNKRSDELWCKKVLVLCLNDGSIILLRECLSKYDKHSFFLYI